VRGIQEESAVEFACDGVFVFVGLLPNTKFLEHTKVALDEQGFVKADSDFQTSVRGVFVSGDVRSGSTMQIASAVGEGATVALKMREFLEGHR
jgi:thioredoxin reductase (NADPH)